MKTIHKLLLVILVYCLPIILLTGGCKNEKPAPAAIEVEAQSEIGAVKSFAAMAAPFPSSKYHYVKAIGAMAYGIDNGKGETVIPNIVNPLVNSQALINYYNQHQAGKFNGLRFYPGYKNYSLVLIMCMAEYDVADPSKKDESDYVILENGMYLEANSIQTTNEDCKLLFEQYKEKVKLNMKPQNTTPNGSDTIRFGRFYYWSDFEKLLAQNNLNKSYIQFDIGYVDKETANNYPAWLLNKFTVEQQQGFTALFHVKDENGKSLLNPLDEYEQNSDVARNNYKNRGLEVGVPCPPRCGTLY